jgi:SAM-dependent methyltransferase
VNSIRSSLIDQLVLKAQNRIFLDIGRSSVGMPGWSTLDLIEGAAVRHDPLELPWPLADQSVFYIRCVGFLQHIPHACLHHPRDPFIEVMEEMWRVLLPGGKLWIVVPHAQTQAGWGDPTNRRMLSEDTFKVLSRAERMKLGLPEEYTHVDFSISHGFTWDEEGIVRELHIEAERPE